MNLQNPFKKSVLNKSDEKANRNMFFISIYSLKRV